MEKRRVKIQKTSYKNQEEKETVSWSDLPQDMSVLILQKLPHLVDLIRFRAVCKNWHIPKDRMVEYKDRHRRPWFCRLSLVKYSNVLVCKITDPADSGNVFKTSKSVKGLGSPCFGRSITVYGSEQGWLIAGCRRIKAKITPIFMYNPYIKEYISLSRVGYCPSFATLSCNPVLRDGTMSRNCQIFLICDDGVHCFIASYRLQDKKWKVGPVTPTKGRCCGMQYNKEQLFCLFGDGTLKRYNLEIKSWILIGNTWGLRIKERLRWVELKGDVLVACNFKSTEGKCFTDRRVFFCTTSGSRRDLKYECHSLVGGGGMKLLYVDSFDFTDYNSMDTVFLMEPPRIS